MKAMGYGGWGDAAGRLTSPGADEGIDGLIHEDRLGLDTIYLQAKRWRDPVGRPEIHKFVGALHGRRARKGVFVTTSTFTREAIDYAAQIDTKIVLRRRSRSAPGVAPPLRPRDATCRSGRSRSPPGGGGRGAW